MTQSKAWMYLLVARRGKHPFANNKTFREEQTRLAINGRTHIHHKLPSIPKHFGTGGWGRGGGGESSSDTTYMLGARAPTPFPSPTSTPPPSACGVGSTHPPARPPPPKRFVLIGNLRDFRGISGDSLGSMRCSRRAFLTTSVYSCRPCMKTCCKTSQ